MNLNIPQYDFYKTTNTAMSYLSTSFPLNTIKKYLKEQPVHILTYYDITLITSGEGEFLIDHQANRVKPQDIIFTRPGEIRKWDDKTIQDGFALIFEEEFLLSFSMIRHSNLLLFPYGKTVFQAQSRQESLWPHLRVDLGDR